MKKFLLPLTLFLSSAALASDLSCGNAIKAQNVNKTLQQCSKLKFNPPIEAVVRMLKNQPQAATYAEAFQAYKKVAESGNVQAQSDLYVLYTQGFGTAPDPVQGLLFLKAAAASGDSQAQLYLGEHHNLSGTPEYDLNKAFEWYQKAAEQGNAVAMAKLARGHYYGLTGKEDEALAKVWWEKAAASNDPVALQDVGMAAWLGLLTGKQGMSQALPYWEKAAKLGYGAAAANLGIRYYFEDQHQKSLSWHEKGAAVGHFSSMLSVADLISDPNTNVKKDFPRAFKIYQELAEEGQVDAQFQLGKFYEEGKGTDKDLAQALLWYQKAADQGFEDAKTAVNRLK